MTLSLAAILIAGSFSLTPYAYSTGWNDDDDDDDDWSNKSKAHCTDPNNQIQNGCFETPTIDTSVNTKKWDVYADTVNGLVWDVYWLKDHPDQTGDPVNPCIQGEPGYTVDGLLELQRGILGGPAEGKQHAELDSDCNGPNPNTRNNELSSVGISQTFSTSENNDYKITFSYKARPDQDIGTNGIRVIWNDAEITSQLKPDIGFSKKDWKYASVTVSGITGMSKLAFEDAGDSDSLGTFIDDVSVIPIKKPMSSITLIKAYTNDNSGTASPIDFTMKIKKVGGTSEITIPHTTTVEVPTGTYTMSETNPDPAQKGSYSSVLVTGDDKCPKMLENSDNNLDEFTLKKGEHITCIIYNDDDKTGQSPVTDPPTITIFKIVEDYGELTFDFGDFGIQTNATGTLEPVLVNGSVITVPVNEPVKITENKFVDLDDDMEVDLEFAEIRGDGHCPEKIGGTVTLSDGQHIVCYIVNHPPGGDIEPGVVFHYETIQITVGPPTGSNCEATSNVPPCIELLDDKSFIVRPDLSLAPQELTPTTLILLTVVPANNFALATQCTVSGLNADGTIIDGFKVECLDTQSGDLPGNVYNFNLALIETAD
jgi:hypothetical protein